MKSIGPKLTPRTAEAVHDLQVTIQRHQEKARTLSEIASEIGIPVRVLRDVQMAWLWPEGVPKQAPVSQ
jgi:hypothetical protein